MTDNRSVTIGILGKSNIHVIIFIFLVSIVYKYSSIVCAYFRMSHTWLSSAIDFTMMHMLKTGKMFYCQGIWAQLIKTY